MLISSNLCIGLLIVIVIVAVTVTLSARTIVIVIVVITIITYSFRVRIGLIFGTKTRPVVFIREVFARILKLSISQQSFVNVRCCILEQLVIAGEYDQRNITVAQNG